MGVQIVRRASEEPLRRIVGNAGLEGSIVLQKVEEGQGGFGASSLGSMDMGQMVGMIGSMKGLIGGGRKARRHRG